MIELKINTIELEKIVEFIMENSTWTNRKNLKEDLEYRFNNFLAFTEYIGDEIIAFCRWNILDDGRKVEVIDMIIRPDYRNQGLMYKMFKRGLSIWNNVETIEYERGYNDGSYKMPTKIFKAQQLLKRLERLKK